jgi:hypothetical protein
MVCLGGRIDSSRARAIRAMPKTRAARLRVQATDIGAAVIDSAAAARAIQVDAIAAGAAGEREQALFVVEMVDQTLFE